LLSPDQHERMVALRRDLHQHPELAHQEHRTAELIARRLRDLGLDEVRTGVGQTGVVGNLKGMQDSPRVLLRADIDALPLEEADRGQPYRSLNVGTHHACGHDGHTAILLTVAELLASRRRDLAGSVTFAFQPAEERVGGAQGMLNDGALDPRPDACFGLHLWNDVDAGHVDVRAGPIFASADAFALALTSPGGHAAMPHQTADPVVAAAQLIVALQTLVSRETPPIDPVALTIGSIHGGTAPNIIPARVEIQGTLRVFDPQVRERLLARTQELVSGMAATFRVHAELKMTDSCPAVINDAEMADLIRGVAERVVGPANVESRMLTLGADDMALFLQAVPGCYFFVGGANQERGLAGAHHSPTYDFDERALGIGVQVLALATQEFLGRRR
jgi:amidohydrolase